MASRVDEPAAELTPVAQLLRFSPDIDLQKLRSSIINAVAASERNCLLALDDQHLISAPAIHSAGVAFLHRRRPENLHVGIGSRYDPPLPQGRLAEPTSLVCPAGVPDGRAVDRP